MTGKAAADCISVIDAAGRRDQVRILIDRMTAANELGISKAVPGQVIVHTDGRLRPIRIGQPDTAIQADGPRQALLGRPAMRVIQTLYWLRNERKHADPGEQKVMHEKLIRILREPKRGSAIRQDLQFGLHTVPAWMQQWLRDLLDMSEAESFSCVPEQRARKWPIEAQSTAIARAMANICNDQRALSGALSGHDRKTLSLSDQPINETAT